MAVRLRLKRIGRKHRPFFRICAIDARRPRDGRSIEDLGTYDPMTFEAADKVIWSDVARVRHWLNVGAQPTEQVASLLKSSLLRLPSPADPGELADCVTMILAPDLMRLLSHRHTVYRKARAEVRRLWVAVSDLVFSDPCARACLDNLLVRPELPQRTLLKERLAELLRDRTSERREVIAIVKKLPIHILTRASPSLYSPPSDGMRPTAHRPNGPMFEKKEILPPLGETNALDALHSPSKLRLAAWFGGESDPEKEVTELVVGRPATLFVSIQDSNEARMSGSGYAVDYLDVTVLCSSAEVESLLTRLPLPPIRDRAANFLIRPEQEGEMQITFILRARNDLIFRTHTTLQVVRQAG